jgi:hypothetical protein
MNNNTITTTENNTTKNITLTEAIRALYGESATTPIKNVVETLKTNPAYSHLSVDYRKVYNTWKRVSGNSKPLKTSKTSVILDLTTTPLEGTVPGVVVSEGIKA